MWIKALPADKLAVFEFNDSVHFLGQDWIVCGDQRAQLCSTLNAWREKTRFPVHRGDRRGKRSI